MVLWLTAVWAGFHEWFNWDTSALSNPYAFSENMDGALCSTANFDLAAAWINNCNEKHQCLNPQSTLFSPTRLLSVGAAGDSIIKLVIRKSSSSQPYATLSYCGGLALPVRLLSHLVGDFERGIPIASLPRTLKEAIEVTRELGLKYIWIDSLCIIQNSTEDWNCEATQMADIYNNSYCNLAATSAVDCDGGLIRDRDPNVLRTTLVNTNWEGSENKLFGVIDKYIFKRDVVEAPLNGRGWVVQERHLSPRTLHFGKHQLFWECYATNACEAYPYNVMPGCELILSKRNLKSPKVSTSDFYRYWHHLVRSYTISRLTKEQDKLPAISGLARRLAPVLSDEYVAGLWKSRLSVELTWTPYGSRVRPKAYRGPSWSWISIDGEVLTGTSYPMLNPVTLINVVDCEVGLLTGDKFGQVRSAVLRLSGRLYPAVLSSLGENSDGVIFSRSKL